MAIKGAEKIREDLEASREIDRYKKTQPKKRPVVNESFVGTGIE